MEYKSKSLNLTNFDIHTKCFIVKGKLYSIWQWQVIKGGFEDDIGSNGISPKFASISPVLMSRNL